MDESVLRKPGGCVACPTGCVCIDCRGCLQTMIFQSCRRKFHDLTTLAPSQDSPPTPRWAWWPGLCSALAWLTACPRRNRVGDKLLAISVEYEIREHLLRKRDYRSPDHACGKARYAGDLAPLGSWTGRACSFGANSSVNRAPPPALSDTVTSPPCAFMVSLTMASPSPAP